MIEGIILELTGGLEKKVDLSTTELDFTHERDFYDENKDFFRKDCLVHLYAMARAVPGSCAD